MKKVLAPAILISVLILSKNVLGAPQAAGHHQEPSPATAAPAPAQAPRPGERPPLPPRPPAVMPPPVTPIVSVTAPNPDPRIGLAAGRWDAAQAAWNMRLISTTPPSEASLGSTHSDLAFSGKYVIQGNYNGFEIWDI